MLANLVVPISAYGKPQVMIECVRRNCVNSTLCVRTVGVRWFWSSLAEWVWFASLRGPRFAYGKRRMVFTKPS